MEKTKGVIYLGQESNLKKDFNIVCNDAIKVLSQLPDGSVDHCITDPPYSISHYDGKKNIGWLNSNSYWKEEKSFSKIDEKWDKFSGSDYETFSEAWLSEIFRVVKPGGNILIFGSYHNIYKIGYLLQKADKKILNSIVWYKRNAFPNITQRMLCESTEYVIWAVNSPSQKAKNWTFNYQELKEVSSKICKNCQVILNVEYVYCPFCSKSNFEIRSIQMRNMWDLISTPRSEKNFGKHPSQKPKSVIERLIKGFTKKGDLVIDPFMGSGTVPLVAMEMGRKFIGIDSSKEYCNLAYKRVQAISTKIKKKANHG